MSNNGKLFFLRNYIRVTNSTDRCGNIRKENIDIYTLFRKHVNDTKVQLYVYFIYFQYENHNIHKYGIGNRQNRWRKKMYVGFERGNAYDMTRGVNDREIRCNKTDTGDMCIDILF